LRPDYNPELHGVVYNYEIFNGEQILDNVIIKFTLIIYLNYNYR